MSKPPTRPAVQDDDIFQDVASQLFELEARKVDVAVQEEFESVRFSESTSGRSLINSLKKAVRVVFYGVLTLSIALYGWGMVMRLAAKSRRISAEEQVRRADQATVMSGTVQNSIPILHNAIRSDPDYPEPYFKLAVIYAEQNQLHFSQAYQTLGQAARERDAENAKILVVVVNAVQSLISRTKQENNQIILPDVDLQAPQGTGGNP